MTVLYVRQARPALRSRLCAPDPGAQRDAHKVHGGVAAELLFELGAVVGDGLIGDVQQGGDLGHGAACGEKAQDFDLACTEGRYRVGVGAGAWESDLPRHLGVQIGTAARYPLTASVNRAGWSFSAMQPLASASIARLATTKPAAPSGSSNTSARESVSKKRPASRYDNRVVVDDKNPQKLQPTLADE
jgi:hypothetical protein